MKCPNCGDQMYHFRIDGKHDSGYLWCDGCGGVAVAEGMMTQCPQCHRAEMDVFGQAEPFGFRCRECGCEFTITKAGQP